MFFTKYWQDIKKMDWQIMAVVFLLIAFGLMAIYSVGLGQKNPDFLYFKKQLLSVAIGVLLLFLLVFSDYRIFSSFAKHLYVISIILLVLVLLFGSVVRGTRGWFLFYGFAFQPVELIKLFLIIFLSFFFARYGRFLKQQLRYVIYSGFFTLAVFVLVMLQPDLGSAFILFFIWLAYVFIIGIKRWQLALIIGFLIVAIIVAWFFFLVPYQKERVYTFLYPESDPLGQGYNITQASIAIGSGGWLGRGVGFGSQSQLKFLPEAHTDFVFAVIAEELGFVGVLVLLFLFSLLFYRIMRAMRDTRDDFSFFLVFGIIVLLFSQLVINVGMNLGLVPVMGISLPLVSYGGSSLITTLLMIGVIQSIIVRNKGVIG